jgi:midasin
MLCIDQSRSMLEGQANVLALTTIISLCLGLEKLEAGTVNLVGFGESIRTLEKSSLPNIPFVDESSNFGQLLEHLLSAGSSSSSCNHWRLCIVISDGICQEHERLRLLVNQCLEQRLLPLLIILDSHKKISELSYVEYPNGKVCFTKYLDTIPFEHYIIVHDIALLPDLLADALQQWFQCLNN